MMKFIKIICGSYSLMLMTSCDALLEQNVTMRKFNQSPNYEKMKLSKMTPATLIFDPFIDVQITKNRLFLQKVDSVYILNVKDEFVEELKKCNVNCVEGDGNSAVIRVDRIIFNEENFKVYHSDGGDYTDENKIFIKIEGTVTKSRLEGERYISVSVDHETWTEKETWFNLFDGKAGDTFVPGLIEKNTIAGFAVKCAFYLSDIPDK